jgi:hypothetical protein
VEPAHFDFPNPIASRGEQVKAEKHENDEDDRHRDALIDPSIEQPVFPRCRSIDKAIVVMIHDASGSRFRFDRQIRIPADLPVYRVVDSSARRSQLATKRVNNVTI